MTFDGVAVHEKDGRRWAQLPSRPVLDGDRELVKEFDGKISYARVMEFDDREISEQVQRCGVQGSRTYIAKEAFAP